MPLYSHTFVEIFDALKAVWTFISDLVGTHEMDG
jgi:hypothetical protein